MCLRVQATLQILQQIPTLGVLVLSQERTWRAFSI
jgi:hypothetical protein